MSSNNKTALYERQNCPIQNTFHSHKCWSTNYLKFKLGYMVAEDWISGLRILCKSDRQSIVGWQSWRITKVHSAEMPTRKTP